ncbi:DNA cytosine methyltransferase [Mesorhizobium sp. SP-1A]|uniref:DNA cytosine methyltransferase n=1 Tax=Mesorhizobium sp. SP-1A TaxID=3077840 RepID=UPI0028F6D7C9|nr:DNA cytosine methyltransferase [Mesorhizobium sp. SP-1A]
MADIELAGIMTSLDGQQADSINVEIRRRDVVRSLVTWLCVSGHPKTSIPKIKSVFSDALNKVDMADDLSPSALIENAELVALINADTDRVTYAQRLLSVLRMMKEDSLELGVADQVFSFTEINPGLGALGLASMNIGGVPHGSCLVAPMARPTFSENRGSDSLLETDVSVDLTLVNLPFSAFVGIGQVDPAVTKIIEAAAGRRKRTACTLFRIDWTIGQRMGINPDAYCKVIARHFRNHEVQSMVIDVEWFVPMEGHELFIAVAPSFNTVVRPVGTDIVPRLASSFIDRAANNGPVLSYVSEGARKFPRQHAGRIDCDYWHDPSAAVVKTDIGHRMLTVGEVKNLLGIDSDFKVPTHEETTYHLLGESVVVPVAERAIRGVLRALK